MNWYIVCSYNDRVFSDSPRPQHSLPIPLQYLRSLSRISTMLFVKLRTLLALSALVSLPSLATPLGGTTELPTRASDVTISGTHTGDGWYLIPNYCPSTKSNGAGTFYTPGLGACGHTNTASDLIVAVGHDLYDNYP